MESQKQSLSTEIKKKMRKYKIIVFLITAFLYAAVHSTRTSWAYSKPTISESINFSAYSFGVLDSSFLAAYAVGLYLSGWLGDRVGLKILLTLGLISASFSFSSFCLIEGFFKERNLLLDSIVFIIDGLGQSTGFPVCVAILSNWFSSKEKGFIFGIWLTNINIGNILGQQIGKIFLDVLHINWVSFYNFPNSKGLDTSEDNQAQEKETTGGFIDAIKTPGVLIYSAVYFCVKAASYGLLFWLPTYLKFEIGLREETATLLAYNELGALVGVVLLGIISDKIKDRSKIIVYGLSCSVGFFILINFVDSSVKIWYLSVLLFFIGVGIGGCSGLIGGAISSDLGEQNQNKSIATITGFIDGSGTVGAAVAQVIIPLFGNKSFLFYTIITMIAAVMTPIARNQIHKSKKFEPIKPLEIEVSSGQLTEELSFAAN